MLDKETYELLKLFYKEKYIDNDGIAKATEHLDDSTSNDPINMLSGNGLIKDRQVQDENNQNCLIGYEITILGAAYVEDKRKQFWQFWLPYGITTAIAIASLILNFVNWA